MESESCEPEQRVSGHDAIQPTGLVSPSVKNASARGPHVARARKRDTDTESDPEPPVTRARANARSVTTEARDVTSDSDVANPDDEQAACARPVHTARQPTANGCAAEPQMPSGRASPATNGQTRREERAPPIRDGVRVEPVSEHCPHMHWIIDPEHTDEQIATAREALDAVVLAFGEQHAAPLQEDSSVIAARAERRPNAPAPARRPDSLPVQPLLPAGQTPDTRAAPRRPRSRCTRVVNIVNVNDSAPAPQQTHKDRAAGDAAAAPAAARVRKTSQPLEMSPERSPRSKCVPADQTPTRRKSRECDLRLPLFHGEDWPGFIAQFEACAKYYRWTDRTKAIRLHTSLVGEARTCLAAAQALHWSYYTLRRHLEMRYGHPQKSAQIQEKLFAMERQPDQSLHEYYDAICSAAKSAALTERERERLAYTAFVYGLRSNKHMHHWVARRETHGTIRSALDVARAYEDEYG